MFRPKTISDPVLRLFKDLFNPEDKRATPDAKPYLQTFYQLRKTFKKEKFGFFKSAVSHFTKDTIPDFVNDYFIKIKSIPTPIFERLQYFFSHHTDLISRLNREVISQLRLAEFILVTRIIDFVLRGEASAFPAHSILIHLTHLMCLLPPALIEVVVDNLLKLALSKSDTRIGAIVILGKFVQQTPPISCEALFQNLTKLIKHENPLVQSAACFSLTLFATSKIADEKQIEMSTRLIEEQTDHEKSYPRYIATICQSRLHIQRNIKTMTDADICLTNISLIFCVPDISIVFDVSDNAKEFRAGVQNEFMLRSIPTIDLVPTTQLILTNVAKSFEKEVATALSLACQKEALSDIYNVLNAKLTHSQIIKMLNIVSTMGWNSIEEGLAISNLVFTLNDFHVQERLSAIAICLDPYIPKLPKYAEGPASIILSYRP